MRPLAITATEAKVQRIQQLKEMRLVLQLNVSDLKLTPLWLRV